MRYKDLSRSQSHFVGNQGTNRLPGQHPCYGRLAYCRIEDLSAGIEHNPLLIICTAACPGQSTEAVPSGPSIGQLQAQSELASVRPIHLLCFI
jgi:hypothetical protein